MKYALTTKASLAKLNMDFKSVTSLSDVDPINVAAKLSPC